MTNRPIFRPWQLNEQDDCYMVHASDHDAPPMGNVVCRLPLDEQGLARGYVIAAAPELLGALEAIVRDSDKLPEAQFQLAVAAIAKARGEP